jgi:hypothetical protein
MEIENNSPPAYTAHSLHTEKFDVIMPVAEKDINNLHYCIENISKNIEPYKIVVIANAKTRKIVEKIRDVEFYDEDTLMENLSLIRIKTLMENITGTTERSGWYFQQFLKMAYAYKCRHEYYLIWDSDTIPLNKITFWDNNGKGLFAIKKECHAPYFKTIEKLFCGKITKSTDKSFIAEHMLINKDCMLRLLRKIENNKILEGTFFYEKIMYAIDRDDIKGSGFSEFETYGNYILTYYPYLYNMRELRTYRDGSMLIKKDIINNKILEWVSIDYDTVSFEEHYYGKLSSVFKNVFKYLVLYRLIPFKIYRCCYDIFNKIIEKIISVMGRRA